MSWVGRGERVVGSRDGRQLRLDLRGATVELDRSGTPALAPGEQAALRVAAVWPGGEDDPGLLLVDGDWSGPDGDVAGVSVLVYASALPRLRRAA